MKFNLSPKQSLASLLLGVSLTASLPAYATHSALPVSLPEKQVIGGVPYVSGGIGADEAAAMKAMASHYALELDFIARQRNGNGVYLAENKVMIRDHEGGIVLDTVADGPFLLTNLPPGQYTVEAVNGNQVQKRLVTLKPGRRALLVFEW